MESTMLQEVLDMHRKYLRGEDGGERADLRGVDLRDAYLRDAYLRRANLRGVDLRGANLSRACIGDADLRGANLRRADLPYADLRGANLRDADLRGANLCDADLSDADLSRAILSDAGLSRADLRGAFLSGANLSGAILSGAKGLLSPIDFLDANFERTEQGYIAYKTFGAYHRPPDGWLIEKGAVIEEVVNFNRTSDCGCGVNVATLYWVRRKCVGPVWKVLIEWPWLAGVCVPYSTDGKIRCEKVRLLEKVQSFGITKTIKR